MLHNQNRAGFTTVSKGLRTILLSTALTTMIAPIATYAEDETKASSFEEIIVTALKRSSSLQSTPISISAITGDKLEKMGADDLMDYIRTVPGLSLVDGGPGQRRIVIRGVQGVGEAQVGLYYDETPVTGAPGAGNNAGGRQPDLKLFDIERVEVLRGPQGTLYGAGSMSGTLRVIMNKANVSEVEGAFDGTISTTRHGGQGYQLNGMINLPIVEDKLAVRTVLYFRDEDGYIDNIRLGNENHNGEKTWGSRFMVSFFPTEDFSIYGSAMVQRTDHLGDNKWSPAAGIYKTREYTQTPFFDNSEIFSLTANWDLGFATMTATSSYYERRAEYNFDTTGFIGTFDNPGICGLLAGHGCDAAEISAHTNYINSILPATVDQPQDIDNWTHEIRLSSNGEDAFNWTIGGFLEDRNTFLGSRVLAATDDGRERLPLDFIFHREAFEHLKQKAIFGELSYDLSDKLTVTVGARYFDYDKNVLGETIVGFAIVNASASAPAIADFSENGWQFKFHASYQVNDDILVYAQMADGYRIGGANQVIGLPDLLVGYESDSLTNYEIGVKTRWADGKYTLNTAAYYIDWDNMQVSGQCCGDAFSFISNAGKAAIKGFEVEFTAYPTDGLEVNLGVNYNDAKLTEDQISDRIIAPGKKGDRIPHVGGLSSSVSAQYNWAVNGDMEGLVRADVTYTPQAYSKLRPDDQYRETEGDYVLFNMKAGVEGADWAVFLYVNNVFDKVALTRVSSSRFNTKDTYSITPRTIGLNVKKNF